MPSISNSLAELMREEEKIVEKIQSLQYEITDRKSTDNRDNYFELLEQNIKDLKQRQKEIQKETDKLREEGSRIGILAVIFTICLFAILHFSGIIDVMPFLQQFTTSSTKEESPYHTPTSPKYDIRP